MDKVVDSLLTTIKPGNLSNDTLLALSLVLSQPTVIAALDLVESHAGHHSLDVSLG
ncbi:hypothetical protein DL93DRAFT_2073357 [Clavulina sp. PMI_390]|nr:hypothetical protein DL93DRAFT_2073357 [Clavulina sp. PMI_390]